MFLLLALLVATANAASIDTHVVNGQVVNPYSYPSQLSLQTSSHICGAVLVSPGWAITAAHCVNPSNPSSYRLICGAHNIHTAESTQQTRTAAEIIVHPNYNPNGQRPAFPNDIAVIRLASAFTISAQCQTAKIPTSSSGDYGNRNGIITGWGRLSGGGALPSRLKYGALTILSTTECNNQWGTTVSSAIHVCVRDFSNYYGACNGDSGGPLHDVNTGDIIGLASFVASGCLPTMPSVYVRISNYRSWIDQYVQY